MEETLNLLLDAYTQAESELLAIVARYTLDGDELDQDTWVAQKLASVKKLRAELIQKIQTLKTLDTAAADTLIKQYILGGSQYVEGFIGTNQQAVAALVADYTKLLTSSRYQMLRSSEDAYRKIIAESSIAGALGIDTRITTARTALARFADEGITGFVTKDGRNYDIRSYVEMASRTTLNNALREGRVRGLEESGKDLIIVSAHSNPSPQCQPYERKVLSISGKDTNYPSLSSAKAQGLFHVNCKHSFTAYVPGVTKVETPQESDNYDATQQQRYAERMTRRWKRRLDVADTPDAQIKAKAKIKEWRNKAKQIAATNDLVYKSNRVSNVQAR